MSPASVGLLFGALLGIAVAVQGWSGFWWVLLFSVVSFVVGKVVQGDIDVSPYVSSAEQRVKVKR